MANGLTLDVLLETAKKAAQEAGEIVNERFVNHKVNIISPSGQHLVTDADQLSQAALIKRLWSVEQKPIVGEEGDILLADRQNGDFWLVDPLDGTKNFASGMGYFCVGIAYIQDYLPILSVIVDNTGTLYYGSKNGLGIDKEFYITFPKKPIPQVARVGYSRNTQVDLHEKIERIITELNITSQDTDKGSALLEMLEVALGKRDAFFRLQTKPWDIGAAHAIAEACGCIVTDNFGNEILYRLSTNYLLNGVLVTRDHDFHMRLVADLTRERNKLGLLETQIDPALFGGRQPKNEYRLTR